ncbi:hypothetical protein [Mycobacterium uberis]|uniref:hypothetical protein n=1 Tax=Mycobacterium uberis TaxID=2162698 RepID=UPI001FB50156|nr:hypothetical protein [Mycobacterium uberis]
MYDVTRVQGTSTITGSTAVMGQFFRSVLQLGSASGSDFDAALAAAVQITAATPARPLGSDSVSRLQADLDASLIVLCR